jgi:hypothetical protein
MLLFIIGFFYQVYIFIGHYIQKKQHFLLRFLIVLADATLATSFVLVNPEIIILFFFFLSVNGILKQKILFKFIGLLFKHHFLSKYVTFCGSFLIRYFKQAIPQQTKTKILF